MSKEELEVIDLNKDEISEDKPSKKKKYNVISLLLISVGVICIVVALSGLYGIYKEYKVGQDIYEQAKEEYVHINVPVREETDSSTGGTTGGTTVLEIPWYEMISVDLEGLQKKYPEVVGWIFFENETISYPVMHTTDNNKYLRAAYDGTYAKAGSIFVEATHSGDFSQMHTLVYGHNQKDANMFGKLKYYKKKEGYYNNHQYFQIFSGDKILRYQIFAYQVVGVDSFVYQEKNTSARVLADKLLENSMINPGIDINDGDKIVTLSTCTDDTINRFVVSAVLIETYDLTEKTLIEN